jgi:hypothetical protein
MGLGVVPAIALEGAKPAPRPTTSTTHGG